MDNSNLKVLDCLKKQFPEKNLDPASMRRIDFLTWKLIDLKKFLVITGGCKGLSKAKKETMCKIVTKTWQDLSSTYYNDTDVSSVRDEELMSLPSSPYSPFSSEAYSLSSPPTSPSSPTSPTPLQRYPITKVNMTEHDFKLWTMQQLQEYLTDRSINKTGNKAKLVNNANQAYILDLPVSFTDPQEEKQQIEEDEKNKLILDDGMLTLPSPKTLFDDWIEAPSHLPDTLYDNVNDYLLKSDAGKAFKGGKSLLLSGHLINVMVHMITPNVRYCYIRGLCHPEQRLSKPPYNVWVCLHKDSGEVVTGECSCVAGCVIILLFMHSAFSKTIFTTIFVLFSTAISLNKPIYTDLHT